METCHEEMLIATRGSEKPNKLLWYQAKKVQVEIDYVDILCFYYFIVK